VRKLKPALQDSEGRSKPWSGSRLVNAFAEQSAGDSDERFAIMAVPGLVARVTVAAFEVRGVHRMAGVLYAVVGTTLYSISSAWAATSLGTIAGSGPVRMDDNGTELAICATPNGYVYSGAVLHSGIANLPSVTDVCFIDGYFVWTVQSSDQFIISGLNDGLTYDPLDVATVEGSPDALIGVENDHRELLFFGATTTEVWYNSGEADFPFSRQGNAFVERGCADRDSQVKIDNGVHFVGDDLICYRLNGYIPTRISTHAIEYSLAQAAWFRAFTYTQEGHKFYVLNTDIGTFAYDMATGAWAERLSYGRAYYRCACAASAYGYTVLGDTTTGKLYTPSLDAYDEDGDPMSVIIELPSLERGDRERATLYAFELNAETGVGTATAADPQAILQYSKDGGRQWSDEMWRTMGAVGEYETRCVWRANVDFRQLQLRITLPEKTRRLVMSYWADVR
jgi:hypothetical protein